MCLRINDARRKKGSLVSECLPVKNPSTPPKVTLLHAAAVRGQVIYDSFRAMLWWVYVCVWVLLAWRPCQLEPPAAAAVMEPPVTDPLLPREQCCHQGAARAPPHLVPFEANRYIMRLLVLSSPWPLLHKSSITDDVLSSSSAACLSASLLPILFHFHQF